MICPKMICPKMICLMTIGLPIAPACEPTSPASTDEALIRVEALEARLADLERRADCAPEMVPVADFCVDRYEASLWAAADCAGTQYGLEPGDYPDTFPANGAFSEPIYACSLPGVMPSREITWFQATMACAASGKRLCTNAEWQMAVMGTPDPGANDGHTNARCNTLAGGLQWEGPRPTGQAGGEPGDEAGCVSRWGVEDGIGNLWEWTADWGQAGETWMSAPGDTQSPWPKGFGKDGTWNVNGKTPDSRNGAAGRGPDAWFPGLPAAFIRGGNWESGEQAGAYSVWLSDNPSVANWILGVRCCRSRLVP